MIARSSRVVTILPNAAPMITPTARSTTLPRAMKLRNSFNMHPVLSDTSGFRCDGVERVMPEDVERAAIGSAEDQLYGPLGNVDAANRLAVARVNEDLTVGDIDIAGAIGNGALAAAFRERLQIAERAAGLHGRAIGAVLGAARHVDALAGPGGDQSVGIEVVRPSPAGRVHSGIRVVGRLSEHAAERQHETAVR